MPDFRYPQFCALARAAEIIGERWTLLILRELFFGPQRFSDLRRRLSEVSPSVLSERLAYLESQAIIKKTELEPPAASMVYELAEHGQAFAPALASLARWGARFLLPPRSGEQLDPDRLHMVLGMYARTRGAPRVTCELHIKCGNDEEVIHLAGGEDGTVVSKGSKPSDVTVSGEPFDLIALLMGSMENAAESGRVRVEGDRSKLAHLPELFELDPEPERSSGPFEVESETSALVSPHMDPTNQGEGR